MEVLAVWVWVCGMGMWVWADGYGWRGYEGWGDLVSNRNGRREQAGRGGQPVSVW